MNDNTLFEIILPVIFFCGIYFAIAEFIGRSKHIGRWWTFFLMFPILPGIIALIFSPSAKNKATKGNKVHLIFGIFLILVSVYSFFAKIDNYQISDFFTNVGFLATGVYLINFANGKIINNQPKFYFDNLSSQKQNFNEPIKFSTNPQQEAKFYGSALYYFIENGNKSEPLTYDQLKIRKISENTYIWRDGLDDWTLAGNLEELKTFFRKEPPPFNGSNNFNTKTPPPFTN